MNRKRRRWLKASAAGLLLVLAGLAVTGWLCFQHVPEWYKPVEIAPDQLQAVRNDLTRVQNEIGERLALGNAPFEYTISQGQVNAWLAAREDIWPLSREWLPPGVSNPVIRFEAGGIRLGATVQVGGVESVVSGFVQVSADERQIHARVLDVASGSLPVPDDLLAELLDAVQSKAGHSLAFSGGNGSPNVTPADLFAGVSVPNEGVWWTSKRPFRVTGLDIEGDLLTLTLLPLPANHIGLVR